MSECGHPAPTQCWCRYWGIPKIWPGPATRLSLPARTSEVGHYLQRPDLNLLVIVHNTPISMIRLNWPPTMRLRLLELIFHPVLARVVAAPPDGLTTLAGCWRWPGSSLRCNNTYHRPSVEMLSTFFINAKKNRPWKRLFWFLCWNIFCVLTN